MATKNPRIHLVIEKPLYMNIKNLASKNDLSLSSQVRDLIIEAMETHEDMVLSRIADNRVRSFRRSKSLSHGNFWKKALK